MQFNRLYTILYYASIALILLSGCSNAIVNQTSTHDVTLDNGDNVNQHKKKANYFAPSIVNSTLLENKGNSANDDAKKAPLAVKKPIRRAIYNAHKKPKKTDIANPNNDAQHNNASAEKSAQKTTTPNNATNNNSGKKELSTQKIATIFFAHRDARLVSSDRQLLNKVITYLRKNPKHNIVLQAYLDESEVQDLAPIQAEALLRKIGIARIIVIKKYLVNNGINDKRIAGSQAGFNHKISDEAIDNRRVELYTHKPTDKK